MIVFQKKRMTAKGVFPHRHGGDVAVEHEAREEGEDVIVVADREPDLRRRALAAVGEHVEGKHREDVEALLGLLLGLGAASEQSLLLPGEGAEHDRVFEG